ncbi:mitochondrial cardiolipin hydrolase-like [Aricia agestis]|uniref:mitochondrial cardiolipin hydrolase-like n=1 Tax=Aricia agestis TaxID=91739 RepID=UPI001C201D40|nr:mitochondrial cardiolipin hydrolase-like [Aricia agestis]
MDWKYAKILLASTAAVVASAVVKKMCKYFYNLKYAEDQDIHDSCNDIMNLRNREINDVILFSDEASHHLRVMPNKGLKICESREINCFKLIKYIKSARETLDVCMYLITSKEIVEHIIRLGQRHVVVRIVVDSDMAFTPPSQIKKLQEYSFIRVQTNKKPILMHHKFCIIDGPKALKRKAILKQYAEKLNIHAKYTRLDDNHQTKIKQVKGFVMSGSLNWSTQAMAANHESVIVTSHPTIVEKFEREFESLWVEDEPALLAPK